MPIIYLENGIRVILEFVPNSRLSHVAYVFDAGSRDEHPNEVGLAHFTEHMLFKGTRKRKSYHILNRIDAVGGDLNAYTTKEKTQYYAIVQNEHTGRAIELLRDIAFDSVFPEREIERERQVIEEEIDMYADNPEESILEDFDQLLFTEHPLGQPILGKRELLTRYTSSDFLEFTRRNYVGKRLVVCLSGGFSLKQAERLINKLLAPLSFHGNSESNRIPPIPRLAEPSRVVQRNVQQMHSVWGGMACSLHHDHYLPMQVLTYLLGGPAMNNRLTLNIREKHGLTYNLYSYFNPYQDCGTWGVYAGYDAASHDRINQLVLHELDVLVQDALTERQLNALKKQYIGSLILSSENRLHRISGHAKDLLDFGELQSLDNSIEHIKALTSIQLLEAAQTYFNKANILNLVYQPDRSWIGAS